MVSSHLYIWQNLHKTRLFCGTQRPEHGLIHEINGSAEFVAWMKSLEIPKQCLHQNILSELLTKMSQFKVLPEQCEVASSFLPTLRVRLHGHLEESIALTELMGNWESTESLAQIVEKITAEDIPEINLKGKTWFIHQENQLAIHLPLPWNDLEGNALAEISEDDLPIVPNTWAIENFGKGLWFLRQVRPSLVGWSSDMGLCPIPILYRNSFNTHLYGIHMPTYNQDEFRNWIKLQPYEAQTRDLFMAKASGVNGQIFIIRCGKLPIPTRDDQVQLSPILQQHLSPENSNIRIDYKQISPYHEVHQDEWVGTWTPAVKGEAGVDLDGKEIPVRQPQNINFKFNGDLRQEILEDGSTKFFATQDCIAKLIPGGIDINPTLVIDGDVGPATGNIRYSKDIQVKGLILSGYEIECGGNLHIKETPDPGVRLRVKGNLICECGIHGQDTVLEVSGNTKLTFIEDASVYCEGSIYIVNHALNAKLYSNEWVVIEGRAHRNPAHGALMGGICNGTKGIWIHSISSEVGFAHVVSGVNLAYEAKSNDMIRRVTELGNRLAQLNKQIKIKPNSPQFNTLDNREKLLIRRQLESMASLAKLRGEMEKKSTRLEEIASNSHSDKSIILIKSALLPEVELQIDDTSMRIRHPRQFLQPVTYRIHRHYLIEIPEPDMGSPPIEEPKAS